MAEGEELARAIAEKIMTYLDTPREVRRERKRALRRTRESWSGRWFGLLPAALAFSLRGITLSLRSLALRLRKIRNPKRDADFPPKIY